MNTNLYLFSNGGKGGRGQDAGDGADIMESYWTHHYLFIANSGKRGDGGLSAKPGVV